MTDLEKIFSLQGNMKHYDRVAGKKQPNKHMSYKRKTLNQ